MASPFWLKEKVLASQHPPSCRMSATLVRCLSSQQFGSATTEKLPCHIRPCFQSDERLAGGFPAFTLLDTAHYNVHQHNNVF
jgi:hypothetical protein